MNSGKRLETNSRKHTNGLNHIFFDLLTILVWTTITFIIIILDIDSNMRPILGIVVVLFIPGYILIEVLFPKRNDLYNIERFALSLGLSIVVVSIFGLLLNFSYGISLNTMATSIWIYTVIFIFIIAHRRSKLSEDEKFSLSFYKIYGSIVNNIKPKCRTDIILTVILIMTALIAIGMMYYVMTTPKIGEKFTEFYVLNTSGKADRYPTDLKLDNPYELLIGISNREYSIVNYTVQIALNKDGLTSILASKELILDHNQEWKENMTFVPDKEGDGMKLEFWLFKESNFTEPYRRLYLWVNSTE